LFWPFSAIILDYFINHNVLSPIQIVASIVLVIAFLKIVVGEESPKFEFKANIRSGLGRGARLGFPTINLDNEQIDINYGVYLVESEINGKIYKGLLHYGQKETFNEPASLELYIKDFIAEMSNEIVNIKEIKKIREIKKFASAEELKRQMEKDLIKLDEAIRN
jgi:FAD synthase